MPVPERISHLSREPLTSIVAAKSAGAAVDPTSGRVRWAFTPAGTDPEADDWVDGNWDTSDGSYLAVVLVGPGAHELDEGALDAYVRVTIGAEDIVKLAGQVLVY